MATETANPITVPTASPNVDKDGAPNSPKIHLTQRAAQKIRALLEKDGVSLELGGLRVGVQGGGCSGLSYAMRLDTQARDRDRIFEE
ncbi:MAG: iron-sulfur cluster biosynthesis family protein, partial [Candidatus Acidiferrum sp.]